jgi:hypothetical protein
MRPWLLLLTLLGTSAAVQAIEEPAFELLRQLGEVQVRQYAPYVVAEVLVDGPADDAGSRAFPILAGYIFGKNQGERKLAMTAPVTQAAAPVKLAMTAPVIQTAANGGQVVQFVLPRDVTLATAPVPTDARVTVREVPGRQVAVIRYSGFWSAANSAAHLDQLTTTLRGAGLAWTGEPVFSRYDPPITPWFLRRNEIWLTLPASP